MPLTLHSPAVEEGGSLPRKYSCDGDDVSPPLSWTEAPDETESLVLIMDDPDAPAGTWVHWVVYDIPPTAEGFDEDVPPRTVLSAGGTHGENSWGTLGYGGPCPPDGTHRYVFKLYALDASLGLDPGAAKRTVLASMEDHVLEEARLVGEYTREDG
jgi:Raf kinase inhibitor-like YbhB/YbcL family protein